MTDRHQVIPRTLCFVFHDDEILLIKASSKKEWEGFYNAVGGHIEKGESIIDSANREIKEETGLNVNDTTLKGIIHVSNFFGKNVMIFVTRSHSDTKEVVSNEEGELIWVKGSEFDDLKMFEDMKPILGSVQKVSDEEMFFGTSEYDGKDKLLSLEIKTSSPQST